MNTPLTQYEVTDAIMVIEGYNIPRPNETTEATFDRAKAEAITQLQRRVENVRSITFKQFTS